MKLKRFVDRPGDAHLYQESLIYATILYEINQRLILWLILLENMKNDSNFRRKIFEEYGNFIFSWNPFFSMISHESLSLLIIWLKEFWKKIWVFFGIKAKGKRTLSTTRQQVKLIMNNFIRILTQKQRNVW